MSAQPERFIPRLDPDDPAPVYPLVYRGLDWALTSSHVIALPWVLMAIHRPHRERIIDLELVLVGTGRDGTWRAMRVDIPFPHDLRMQAPRAQEYGLRQLPEHVTIRTADGHPQHVDIWVLTEGTPIVGRLGLAGAHAVSELLVPFGFNLESH